jgi:hypothetical protein
MISQFIPGGINNDTVKPGYPTQPNTAENLRIGADWADPTERIESTDPVAGAQQAYGGPYPHPLLIGGPRNLRITQ